MSSTDDASARLSSALGEILSGAGPQLPARDEVPLDDTPPTADWSVDDDDDDDPVDTDADQAAGADSVAESSDGDTAVAGNGGPAAPTADTEAYVLPEIVPATSEPEPAPVTPPPAQHVAPTAPAAPPAPASPPTRAGAPATSWSDHVTATPTGAPGGALRAPGRRPRVRRVTRVVRHVDPWSTFKIGLLFSAVAYVVLLTAGVLLWQVADSTGTLDNVERWFTQFGWETFELKGGEIFHNAWIIGLFGVVAMTGGLVLLATLYNLVSDIVGGIRVTVLEEEVVERTISSTRRYVVRRPGVVDAGASQDWDVDGDEPPPSAARTAEWSVDDEASRSGTEGADWSVDDEADDEPAEATDPTDRG